jgi:hypothetical protein
MPAFLNLKSTLTRLIKVLSIGLISSALGLELWNLYTGELQALTSGGGRWLIYLERFALISHSIEGVVAAFCAPSRGQFPVSYGIYTFFVGTVGLIELFTTQQAEG